MMISRCVYEKTSYIIEYESEINMKKISMINVRLCFKDFNFMHNTYTYIFDIVWHVSSPGSLQMNVHTEISEHLNNACFLSFVTRISLNTIRSHACIWSLRVDSRFTLCQQSLEKIWMRVQESLVRERVRRTSMTTMLLLMVPRRASFVCLVKNSKFVPLLLNNQQELMRSRTLLTGKQYNALYCDTIRCDAITKLKCRISSSFAYEIRATNSYLCMK